MAEPDEAWFRELMSVLPHRPPMLLIDGLVEASPKRVVAVKEVRGDEPWLEGHFPGRPVMPGVMLIEAMAQTCAVLHYCNEKWKGILYLGRSEAQFFKPVLPRERLRIVATRVKSLPRLLLAEVEVEVGETVVARSRLHFGAPKKG